MRTLTKSESMKKVINDKYKKRYKEQKGIKDAQAFTIREIDNSIRCGSSGRRRLKSW